MFTPSIQSTIQRAIHLDGLRQHISTNGELSHRAKELAHTLLDEGRLSSKSTNAELGMQLADYSERTIQRAFGDLTKMRYGMRKPGANTSGYDDYLPPLWTWHTSILCENSNLCHPVITIEFGAGIAIVDSATGEVMREHQTQANTNAGALARPRDYWQELEERIKGMSNAELGEMRYNAIYMRRKEEQNGSKRAKFWRIQEYIYAGALADRGIIQPSVVLMRLRTQPIGG